MSWKLLGLVATVALIAGCKNEGGPEADSIGRAIPAEAAETADVNDDTDSATKARQTGNEITCTYPVKPDDTAETIKARFGDDAKVETLIGPEGIEIPGMVLWPNDPKRRVDVSFVDEKRTEIAGVDVGEGSEWTLASIKVGDTLAKAQEVNGKPIRFYGFEWDYGGYVSDLNGGKLDKLGGCVATFRLTYTYPDYDPPMSFIGDTEVSSDAPDLNTEKVTIYAMGVGFPGEE